MLHPDFGGDAKRVLKALGRSLAIIEFEPNGKIIAANENFCRLLGYEPAEIKGKPHSLLVDPDTAKSADYKAFWAKLERGEFEAGEYKRVGKDGSEVWIHAFYNPVVSASGKALKIVEVASDITAAKLPAAENAAKLEAISRAQASSNMPPTGRSSRRTRISSTCRAIRSRSSKASIIACSSTRPTRSRPNTRSSGGS